MHVLRPAKVRARRHHRGCRGRGTEDQSLRRAEHLRQTDRQSGHHRVAGPDGAPDLHVGRDRSPRTLIRDRHRSVSAQRDDHLTDALRQEVPGGRDEIWRFTPLRRFAGLLDAQPSSAHLAWDTTLPEGVVVDELAAEDPALAALPMPVDRLSAVALGRSGGAVRITVPEAAAAEPVVVRLRGDDAEAVVLGHVVLDIKPFAQAVVVLAAAALDALIRGDADSQPARRWLRLVIRRLLPAAAAACLLCMLLARESAGYLFDERIAAAVAAAIRPGNPAIWVPLVLMAATAIALSNVLRGTPDAPYAARPLPLGILFAVVTVDLASFAGFVDVDMREYPCARALVDPPPLARELLRRSDAPGERLWVPRIRADYARPVEVLWPQLNVLHRIPVLNGYGPMWPAENRALLHFMPWGAAQDALGLLWNPKLLRSLGVRWLAARSEQERELMSLAMAGPPHMDAVRPCGDGGEVALRGRAWRVPVSISTPGVYAVEFRAVPGRRNHDRWYLWLASGSEEKIGDVLWYEPADFIFGPRMVRGFFVCTEAAPGAQLCAYGEPRCEVTLSDVRFGRVADWPPGPPVAGPYRQVAALPDGVVLYELRGARPRYAWADADADGESLTRVIEELQFRPDTASLPADARSQDPATRLGEGAGSIRAVEEDFTHIVLDVFNNSTATLVFNEAFDPGWRASIDGQPAKMVRAAAVVQAVRVPAGRHRIEFSYRPVGLSAGLTFSGLGLLATAAYGLLNRRRTPT